ncbi:MAG: DUF86 domain-containing protein [Candidatus Falkowbacteria bacterium]
MKKDNLVYVDDMLESVEAIQRYTADKTEVDLANDGMLRDAVMRRFEVLGEAANRLSHEFLEANPGLPIKMAVSMRNLLIHDYDNIRIEKVWEAIQNDLPDLKIQLEKLLA